MNQNQSGSSLEEMDSASPQKDNITKDTVEDTANTSKESTSDKHHEVKNGKDSDKPLRRSKRTRSRSKTPQIKNEEKSNSVENFETVEEKKEENEIKDKVSDELNKSQNSESKNVDDEKLEMSEGPSSKNENQITEEVNTTDEFILDSEAYMEPLVLQSDETCPELEFEEESDKDSGKYSPIISRCMTRRSQNRNIPTPKTPKSLDELEFENGNTSETEGLPRKSILRELNETDNSNTDNLSTKVQVGGDATRLEFSEGESYFLSCLKNKEHNSSRRYISSRRSIRPSSEDIRKKHLKISNQRANLSIPFFSSRDSVERAPSVKRKSRSETPEDRKRFKEDSSGFLAKITSPLNTIRTKLSSAPKSTSTPKLTSYRDHKNQLGGEFLDEVEISNAAKPENQWCTLM
ncbi:hypothetical protein WA026_007174 [Henosepilachna vigintioctopunctata]